MPANAIKNFLKLESAGGILLFVAALLALIMDNSLGSQLYNDFLEVHFTISIGPWTLSKSLLLWINDGLMAIFFFLVGMELKRELIEGQLSHIQQAVLPVIAAVGGMVVPALLYVYLNADNAIALRGWAVPVATDIAFALGVLSLLGRRIPVGLKVFLTALAIIDDIGAIVIIAVFHTKDLSLLSLGLAGVCLLILMGFNVKRVHSLSPYIIIGVFLWLCVLKSGVHATLAGVLLAFVIPMETPDGEKILGRAEKMLHPWVAFFVMPLFAFANAGIQFSGLSWQALLRPIPLGIIVGLFLGKQLGIFLTTWVAVKCRFAKLPSYCTWIHIYGLSILCGIGFTMSLFIGMLAYKGMELMYIVDVRVGVLFGSLISGFLGYGILRFSLRRYD